MGVILVYVGFAVSVICSFWFLFKVFKQSVLWGIACLITGIASIIVLFLYWDEVKEPFFWSLGGMVLIVVGAVMSPDAAFVKALMAA